MGNCEEIIDSVRILLEPIIERKRIDLVDLEFGIGGGRGYLRIFIDKQDGVTVEDCGDVSRELGVLLDVQDTIKGSYTMEVSSPGLNRPLKNTIDYQRFRGKRVKIKTKIHLYERKEFVGNLIDFSDDIAEIDVHGKTYFIPFDDIRKANLEFES